MSKALSDQLRLIRKRRSALDAGDMDEYRRLSSDSYKLNDEEEVDTDLDTDLDATDVEPTDTEPVVEEVSSEEVPSSFPPAEPSSTTSLTPVPPPSVDRLETGEIPGEGSPTFTELAESEGAGAFRTAFAGFQDFLLDNAREGGERSAKPLDEQRGEIALGQMGNAAIAGLLASYSNPWSATAMALIALYPSMLKLSDDVLDTDFGERGVGFGGDPLDPTQWLGGLFLPRTVAQELQDHKDHKILNSYPSDSPEALAAAERLKVSERSSLIVEAVQSNNPGEVASGYTNDRAYAGDFSKAAENQPAGSDRQIKLLTMGTDLATANEAVRDRFSGLIDRDKISPIFLQTDLMGRGGESGVNISKTVRQLRALTIDRMRKEDPSLSADEIREKAARFVSKEVQAALGGHPFAQSYPIIDIGNDDAIEELMEMDEVWGDNYGELGALVAQSLQPFSAVMTPTKLSEKKTLLSPEQISTESTLMSGARLANIAASTMIAAGAKFDYYPVVGPWLAKMGIIDPDSAAPADPEEVLRWLSEGGDAIDAAPHFARAVYDHMYPDFVPGSDTWNEYAAVAMKKYPLWFQGVPILSTMLFEPDPISVAMGPLGKFAKMVGKSVKLQKLYKFQRILQEDAIPKLKALENELDPYVVKGHDAEGNPIQMYKDIPPELEAQQAEKIERVVKEILDGASDDPELQQVLQLNILRNLKANTATGVKEQWQASVKARRALKDLKAKTTKESGDAEKALGLELRSLESTSKAADAALDLTTNKLRSVAQGLRGVMPEFFEAEKLNTKAVNALSRKGLQTTIEKATQKALDATKEYEEIIFNSKQVLEQEASLFARLQAQKALLEQAQQIARAGLRINDEVVVQIGEAPIKGKFLRYEAVDALEKGPKRAFIQLATKDGPVVRHYDPKDVRFDYDGVINRLNPRHGKPVSTLGKQFRILAKEFFFGEIKGDFKAADGSIWVPARGLESLKEGQIVRWLDGGELKSIEEMTVKTKGTLEDGTDTATIFAGKKRKPSMTVTVPLDQVYTLKHRDVEAQLDVIVELTEARAVASAMHRGEEATEAAINAWYARNFKGFARDLKGEVKPLVEGDEVAAQGDVLDDIMYQGPATAGAATAEEAVEAARLWKELGTESPYFKKWFGDSKAVDFFGKPLSVFHGTSKGGFTEFAREEGMIHFFTRDRGQASTYAYGDAAIDLSEGRRKKRQRGIYDVYLRLRNPLVVEYSGRRWDDPRRHDFGQGPEEFDNIEDLAEAARDAGYDGVIAQNIIDYGEFKTKAVDEAVDQTKPTTEYLVFDPENIKSTANRGTFDETGRLLFQGADEPASVDDIVKVLFQEGDEGARMPWERGDPTTRVPELTAAAKKILAGTADAPTRAEYQKLIDEYKPVYPYTSVPAPATRADMVRGLSASDKKKVEKIDGAANLEAGTVVGLRLDIPAYKREKVWVPTIHRRATVIGHQAAAAVDNVKLTMGGTTALKIAAGEIAKTPFATIKGGWSPATTEDLVAEAEAALKSDDWVQVGMDPERHSFFYDRKTQQPLGSADRVIQIGPLVLAKNAKPLDPKLEARLLYQTEEESAKAAVQFVEDNKAILYAFEQADVSSLLHEIGHVFRRDLLRSGWQGKLDSDVLVRAFTTKDERHIGDTVTFDGGEGVGWTDLTKAGKTRTPEEMDKIQGKRSRKRKAALDKRARGLEDQSGPATWTVKSEERFTRAMEKYLATGRSPSLELDGVFKKFKSWMTEIYVKIRNSAIGRDVPKEVREVFDRMLTGAMTTEGYSSKNFNKARLKAMLDSRGILYKSKDTKKVLAKKLADDDLNRTAEYRRFSKRREDMAKQAAELANKTPQAVAKKLAPGLSALVKGMEDELKPLTTESNKVQNKVLSKLEKFDAARKKRNKAKQKLALRVAYEAQKVAKKLVKDKHGELIEFTGKASTAEAHLDKQLAKIDAASKKINGSNKVQDVRLAVEELNALAELMRVEGKLRPARRNLLKHPILKSVIRDRANDNWIVDPKEFVDAIDEFYVPGALDEFLATPEGAYLEPIVKVAREGGPRLTYNNDQMKALQLGIKKMEDAYREGHLAQGARAMYDQMWRSFRSGNFKTVRVPVPFSNMVKAEGVQVGVSGSATRFFWNLYKKWDPAYSKYGELSKQLAKNASRHERFLEHAMGDLHNVNMTNLDGDYLAAHIRYMDTTEAIDGRYGSTMVNTLGDGMFKEAQSFLKANITTTPKGKLILSNDFAGDYTEGLIRALERTFLPSPKFKLQPRISEAASKRLRPKVLELLSDDGMTYDKFLRELAKASNRTKFGRQDVRGITMASRALIDAAAWQHTIRAIANTSSAMLTPKEALQMTNFMAGEMDKVDDVAALWAAAGKLGMDLSEATVRPGVRHGQSEQARVKNLVRWNLDDGKILNPEELVEHNAKLEAKLTAQGLTPEQITPLLAASGVKVTDPRQVFIPEQMGQSLAEGNAKFIKELDVYYSAPKGFDPQRSIQKYVRMWKGLITSGLGLPRPKYYVNNMVGDFSQIWQTHGLSTAVKVSSQNVVTNIPYVGPRIQNVTSKMSEKFGGVPVLGTAVEAIFNPNIGRIFKGEEGVIKVGDETISLSTLRERLALDGVLDTFTAREVMANIDDAASELIGVMQKQSGLKMSDKVKAHFTRKVKSDLDAFAMQVQQRQRVGLYLELRKQGLNHDGAVKGVKDALYDWSGGFSKWEQGWVMGLFMPFYRFWKLAAKQMLQAGMEPFVMDSGEYMLKAMTGQTQLARMRAQSRILAGVPTWAAYQEAEEAEEGKASAAFEASILSSPWWKRPGMTSWGKAMTEDQKYFMLKHTGRKTDTIATAMSSPMTSAEMYSIAGYVSTSLLAAARAAGSEDEVFNGLRAWEQFKKYSTDIGGPVVEGLIGERRTAKSGYRRISPGQESALKLFGDFAQIHHDEDGRLVANNMAVTILDHLPILSSQWSDTANGWKWSQLFHGEEEVLKRFLYTLGHISGPVRDYPSDTQATLYYALKKIDDKLKKATEEAKVGKDPMDRYIKLNELD